MALAEWVKLKLAQLGGYVNHDKKIKKRPNPSPIGGPLSRILPKNMAKSRFLPFRVSTSIGRVENDMNKLYLGPGGLYRKLTDINKKSNKCSHASCIVYSISRRQNSRYKVRQKLKHVCFVYSILSTHWFNDIRVWYIREHASTKCYKGTK